MNRTALLLLSACIVLALVPAWGAASEIRHLTGVYNSGYQDAPRRLRAEFKSTAVGQWDVVFHFTHGGQKLSYVGTAEGSLTDGELSGRVSAGRGRIFVFHGEVEDGKFRGKHAEVEHSGEETETGPLRLE